MAKILIVDDRPTNRELLLTLLGYVGHQLLEATDGEEGLAITRAQHPDLIITDIMMPKMDGYEFARQVRADALIKDTQIIFYTSSYIVAETLRLANACGVSIVIGKPIEPENFLKKINEALTTKQVPTVAPASEEFHREHMRILTDTLVNKVEQLEAEIAERKRSEEQYRKLFEDSPISLWVEDFSEVKKRINALQESGVEDVLAYLRKNPDFVKECVNLVQVLDVNTATLKLYHANDKADLLGSLADTAAPMSLDQMEYELIQLAKGQLNFEREGIDQTITGEKIYVRIHWSAVPGYEESLARVIVSTVDVTEQKRGELKIHHQVQRLNALRAIDLAISNTFDMNLSLKIVIHEALSQLGVSAASVLLFNPTMSTLEYMAGEGFNFSGIEKTLMRIGEGLAGQAAFERTIIQVTNLQQVEKEFTRKQLLKEEEFVSYFAVPLIAKGELKGVFEVFTRTEFYPDKEWINFLETLSGQAALAIHDSQLFNGLQRSNIDLRLAYDATIEGWSAALDLRDKETEGHSQRVTEMTIALARRIGISDSELTQIRRGALLHDIGKLGVPDHILLKPDKLTEDEWVIMQKHPTYAYEMLSSISYLKPALDIPYCHHEKWDGSGYPRGLKNENIPLAARIFAIVDVWDALTSDRPYRPAWSRERALEHIRGQSGTHFDPQIVEAFLKMMTTQ
jgi:putative nucleotidyltransferase with HDIG domain